MTTGQNDHDHVTGSAANIRPEGGSPNNGGADVRTPDTAAAHEEDR